MRKLLLEFFLLIACTICQAQQFVKVESLDDVHEGIDYVLVCESQELGYATYNASKKALATIPITISNNSISDATGLAKIHLQATDGAWLMLDVTTNHYIGATNKNTDLEYVTGSGRKPLLKWTLQGDSIIHVNTLSCLQRRRRTSTIQSIRPNQPFPCNALCQRCTSNGHYGISRQQRTKTLLQNLLYFNWPKAHQHLCPT